MPTRELLEEQMTLRLAQADVERLDALEARVPSMSRNAMAREALRIGMQALAANPGLLIRPARQLNRKRGGKR